MQVVLWLPLCQCVYKTPRPRKRRKKKSRDSSPAQEVQYDLTPLEDLLRALEAADVAKDSSDASPGQSQYVKDYTVKVALDRPSCIDCGLLFILQLLVSCG